MRSAEREWMWPSAVLTLLSGLAAFFLIPDSSGLLPALSIAPAWMVAAALIAGIFAFIRAFIQGNPAPGATLKRYLREEWKSIALVSAIMLLAAANMIAFMWVKPLLNYLVPFTADPLLADLDHALFLGHDPFTLLAWLNVSGAGLLYHPLWFISIIIALLASARAPQSVERSAVLASYFLLWSVVGPLIHIILPAAGPIFYERMGYGMRFAALDGGAETRAVADYLWSIYASSSFGAGSGISAMPSMHVTMSTWIAIAFAQFMRPWLPVALLAWAVIFVLSIALGWHYAMDGLVGALAAIACYSLVLRALKFNRSRKWAFGIGLAEGDAKGTQGVA